MSEPSLQSAEGQLPKRLLAIGTISRARGNGSAVAIGVTIGGTAGEEELESRISWSEAEGQKSRVIRKTEATAGARILGTATVVTGLAPLKTTRLKIFKKVNAFIVIIVNNEKAFCI
ncbi:Isoprenyl transferase [Dirofilaria immitis]|nr:hypothetical protein [Dirofilaria immitis]